MSVSTQRAWLCLPCTHGSYQHVSHTHSQVPGPTPPSHSFSHLWHRVPWWHQSAPLAWWPSHHLVRSPWCTPMPILGICLWMCIVCMCVWACLSGTCPNLMALCHCPPTVCFLSLFLLCYSTHHLRQLSWALSFNLWCSNSRILHCRKYT